MPIGIIFLPGMYRSTYHNKRSLHGKKQKKKRKRQSSPRKRYNGYSTATIIPLYWKFINLSMNFCLKPVAVLENCKPSRYRILLKTPTATRSMLTKTIAVLETGLNAQKRNAATQFLFLIILPQSY